MNVKPYKFFLLGCLGLFGLSSCEKDSSSSENICQLTISASIAYNGNAPIPINSQNFWVYQDSLWENDTLESVYNTQFNLDKVYDWGTEQTLEFSSILPPLTLRNDSLFSTSLHPGAQKPNCYTLEFPMFFSPTDTVIVDTENSIKRVFTYTDSIHTPKGSFTNSIVYQEGEVFEVITHPQVGILKISFYRPLPNGGRSKRRILSLKNYNLQ